MPNKRRGDADDRGSGGNDEEESAKCAEVCSFAFNILLVGMLLFGLWKYGQLQQQHLKTERLLLVARQKAAMQNFQSDLVRRVPRSYRFAVSFSILMPTRTLACATALTQRDRAVELPLLRSDCALTSARRCALRQQLPKM